MKTFLRILWRCYVNLKTVFPGNASECDSLLHKNITKNDKNPEENKSSAFWKEKRLCKCGKTRKRQTAFFKTAG